MSIVATIWNFVINRANEWKFIATQRNNEWILRAGKWDDNGKWDDAQNWKDS